VNNSIGACNPKKLGLQRKSAAVTAADGAMQALVVPPLQRPAFDDAAVAGLQHSEPLAFPLPLVAAVAAAASAGAAMAPSAGCCACVLQAATLCLQTSGCQCDFRCRGCRGGDCRGACRVCGCTASQQGWVRGTGQARRPASGSGADSHCTSGGLCTSVQNRRYRCCPVGIYCGAGDRRGNRGAELSAEACECLEWRFTLKRVAPTPAQPQEFMRSAAESATASLSSRNGLNWGRWLGAIQAALATISGINVMAVSKAAAATAAAAMLKAAAAMATATGEVPVVVSTAASRRLASASATVSGLSAAAAAPPVTYG